MCTPRETSIAINSYNHRVSFASVCFGDSAPNKFRPISGRETASDSTTACKTEFEEVSKYSHCTLKLIVLIENFEIGDSKVSVIRWVLERDKRPVNGGINVEHDAVLYRILLSRPGSYEPVGWGVY
ncbi:hypothetical protein evm_000482 [Chilo suppressalis]|nr:hypothetical protein evm_000482 [Chilo suppressalis]